MTLPQLRAVNQLVIVWPEPKPATFEITAELFEALIVELNEHRVRASLMNGDAPVLPPT